MNKFGEIFFLEKDSFEITYFRKCAIIEGAHFFGQIASMKSLFAAIKKSLLSRGLFKTFSICDYICFMIPQNLD